MKNLLIDFNIFFFKMREKYKKTYLGKVSEEIVYRLLGVQRLKVKGYGNELKKKI